VAAKPKPASLFVTKSWALVETSGQYCIYRRMLADILKYLINRSVELRESHALLVSFRGSSLGCVEAGTGSRI
jgi:hypothetical protein